MSSYRASVLQSGQPQVSRLDLHEFDGSNLMRAVNLLCYGVNLIKHRKKGKSEHRLMYIFEDDPQYLQYYKPTKTYVESRIPLLEINEIREHPTNELFKNLLSDNVLQLSYNDKKVVLEFEHRDQRDLWWQGLQYFITEAEGAQQTTKRQDFAKYIGKKMFFLGDTDGSKSLSFAEVKKVILQMHVEIPDVRLQALFNQHDSDQSGTIEYDEFLKLVKELLTYEELRPIYKKYASYTRGLTSFEVDQGLMTKQDFHHFLTQVQKQNITQLDLTELFQMFSSESAEFNQQRLISFSQFTSYLMNPLNSMFRTEKGIIYQDMTRPLTDYYINSSHNTYLMSNQLTGQSSIDAYINAFQKGCRCVELDCWDGPNGFPIIYHGYTMTTKITFESVIKCIKEYAFKYSKYPLILSLEVHCQIDQQDKMAEIMNDYLGEMILKVPNDWNQSEYYPSPEELINKIILKGKGNIQAGVDYRMGKQRSRSISAYEPDDEDNNSQRSVEGHVMKRTKAIGKMGLQGLLKKNIIDFDEQKEINSINKRISEQFRLGMLERADTTTKNSKAISLFSTTKDPYERSDLEDKEAFDDQRSETQRTINQSLSSVSLKPKYRSAKTSQLTVHNITALGSMTNGKQRSFEEGDEEAKSGNVGEKKIKDSIKLVAITTMFGISMNLKKKRSVWEISSLDENKLFKIFTTQEKQLLDFHRKHFTRIYPAGARVDSSNYDPIASYNAGSQIVALNFQTGDMPMMLNFCKFMENGGLSSGYVLKPEWMLHDASSPKLPSDFKTVVRTINVHILSGQQLKSQDPHDLSDIIDPFVKVSVRGTASDEQANPAGRSATIQNNGLNPNFNFKWKAQLTCPDLAILVIEVYDEDMMQKNFIGWTAIPVNCLRQGYRNVQLLSKQLKQIQGSLLFASIEIDYQ